MYKEIKGDLIALAKAGEFDVIAHGCNCFCRMGAGIAPQMAAAFGCDKFTLERTTETVYQDDFSYELPTFNKGNINKLGQIDFVQKGIKSGRIFSGWDSNTKDIHKLTIVNAYTQYNHTGKQPLNYDALELCLYKIGHIFKGKKIGLPMIGCGLAGGDWNVVKPIIQDHLENCDVTVVIYNK